MTDAGVVVVDDQTVRPRLLEYPETRPMFRTLGNDIAVIYDGITATR